MQKHLTEETVRIELSVETVCDILIEDEFKIEGLERSNSNSFLRDKSPVQRVYGFESPEMFLRSGRSHKTEECEKEQEEPKGKWLDYRSPSPVFSEVKPKKAESVSQKNERD